MYCPLCKKSHLPENKQIEKNTDNSLIINDFIGYLDNLFNTDF